jgi:hypothetical protein
VAVEVVEVVVEVVGVADWPRTLGTVPIVAVCCARRVRVTSRMLTKVRLVCHVDLQVMDFQAREQIGRTLVYHNGYISVSGCGVMVTCRCRGCGALLCI